MWHSNTDTTAPYHSYIAWKSVPYRRDTILLQQDLLYAIISAKFESVNMHTYKLKSSISGSSKYTSINS